jgi:hypothetical protein
MGATYKGHRLKLAKHPCRAQVSENGKLLTCLDMFRIVTMKEGRRVVMCAMHRHSTKGKESEVYR